jgi:large subunit ribosomal protein L6
MSRIGRQPIQIPADVQIEIVEGQVAVIGPRGSLTQSVNPDLSIDNNDGQVTVARPSEAREHRALHGLTRTLIANMVTGVTQGFQKTLELVGVGYRVQQNGDGITLQLGFSHPVEFQPLSGINLEVEGNNRIHVSGIEKQVVGEMAARIRRVRPPNRYSGKGVRYSGERVILKPGKSAARKG